jgi:manganese transport protein
MHPEATDTKPNDKRISAKEMLGFFGPAFVASVAYIDPGNFASNIVGGARYGYTLLWVLLWSNAMAVLVQYLSAKLGIATGKTLPELCREEFSRPVVWMLWVGAEISAIATDLAEFLGAALGFYLLFGPAFIAHGMSRTAVMLMAALATTVFVFLLLALNQRGFRHFEGVIIALVSAIGFCYAIEIVLTRPAWRVAAYHVLVPQLSHETLYIAVAMLGATVMPHVIYLHSSLMQPRMTSFMSRDADVSPDKLSQFRRRYLRYETLDILVAMNGAWLINSAMLIMAAAALAGVNEDAVAKLEGAYQTLGPLLGPLAQVAFAIALLCSGLSSSTIGVLAGQVVIEGFLAVKFPIYLRRLITIIPAIIVIAMGLDELKVLLLSQAVLSFGIPFALVPLVILTNRRRVMGEFRNNRATTIAGWAVASLIIGLNCMLLIQIITG